jgi:hypothetical protein
MTVRDCAKNEEVGPVRRLFSKLKRRLTPFTIAHGHCVSDASGRQIAIGGLLLADAATESHRYGNCTHANLPAAFLP